MSWDYQPSGGGTFLRIESGSAARIRIASEPLPFTKVFKPDEPATERIAFVVLAKNMDGTAPRAAIYEAPVAVFRQIKKLMPVWGDPSMYDLQISKEGSGLQTKYSVVPIPPQAPMSHIEAEILSNAEIDLVEKLSGPGVSFPYRTDAVPSSAGADTSRRIAAPAAQPAPAPAGRSRFED